MINFEKELNLFCYLCQKLPKPAPNLKEDSIYIIYFLREDIKGELIKTGELETNNFLKEEKLLFKGDIIQIETNQNTLEYFYILYQAAISFPKQKIKSKVLLGKLDIDFKPKENKILDLNNELEGNLRNLNFFSEEVVLAGTSDSTISSITTCKLESDKFDIDCSGVENKFRYALNRESWLLTNYRKIFFSIENHISACTVQKLPLNWENLNCEDLPISGRLRDTHDIVSINQTENFLFLYWIKKEETLKISAIGKLDLNSGKTHLEKFEREFQFLVPYTPTKILVYETDSSKILYESEPCLQITARKLPKDSQKASFDVKDAEISKKKQKNSSQRFLLDIKRTSDTGAILAPKREFSTSLYYSQWTQIPPNSNSLIGNSLDVKLKSEIDQIEFMSLSSQEIEFELEDLYKTDLVFAKLLPKNRIIYQDTVSHNITLQTCQSTFSINPSYKCKKVVTADMNRKNIEEATLWNNGIASIYRISEALTILSFVSYDGYTTYKRDLKGNLSMCKMEPLDEKLIILCLESLTAEKQAASQLALFVLDFEKKEILKKSFSKEDFNISKLDIYALERSISTREFFAVSSAENQKFSLIRVRLTQDKSSLILAEHLDINFDLKFSSSLRINTELRFCELRQNFIFMFKNLSQAFLVSKRNQEGVIEVPILLKEEEKRNYSLEKLNCSQKSNIFQILLKLENKVRLINYRDFDGGDSLLKIKSEIEFENVNSVLFSSAVTELGNLFSLFFLDGKALDQKAIVFARETPAARVKINKSQKILKNEENQLDILAFNPVVTVPIVVKFEALENPNQVVFKLKTNTKGLSKGENNLFDLVEMKGPLINLKLADDTSSKLNLVPKLTPAKGILLKFKKYGKKEKKNLIRAISNFIVTISKEKNIYVAEFYKNFEKTKQKIELTGKWDEIVESFKIVENEKFVYLCCEIKDIDRSYSELKIRKFYKEETETNKITEDFKTDIIMEHDLQNYQIFPSFSSNLSKTELWIACLDNSEINVIIYGIGKTVTKIGADLSYLEDGYVALSNTINLIQKEENKFSILFHRRGGDKIYKLEYQIIPKISLIDISKAEIAFNDRNLIIEDFDCVSYGTEDELDCMIATNSGILSQNLIKFQQKNKLSKKSNFYKYDEFKCLEIIRGTTMIAARFGRDDSSFNYLRIYKKEYPHLWDQILIEQNLGFSFVEEKNIDNGKKPKEYLVVNLNEDDGPIYDVGDYKLLTEDLDFDYSNVGFVFDTINGEKMQKINLNEYSGVLWNKWIILGIGAGLLLVLVLWLGIVIVLVKKRNFDGGYNEIKTRGTSAGNITLT